MRGAGRTMLIGLTQQVPLALLILLLVFGTGTSMDAQKSFRDVTHGPANTGGFFTERSLGRESSSAKQLETTPWSVTTYQPDPARRLATVETSFDERDGNSWEPDGHASTIVTLRTGDIGNALSTTNVISMSSSPMKLDENSETTPRYVTPTTELEIPRATSASQRRQIRHTPDKCEKFTYGDEVKMEFYSPNYPMNYPNNTNCVRVLKAEEGMLLKLDFRDDFKLEDSPECRFDFLEVRDGQYGYSNLLGTFCGTNFPPEITSKTRYLWLKFHSDDNIEAKGFKAVYTMIPRPTYPGVPPEPEPCIKYVTGDQAIIQSKDFEDRKKQAEIDGLPLDCMWVIKVKEDWKIQLSFSDTFKLQRPNECDANFVDVFSERTDMQAREKNFCGSIADTVMIKTNTAYVRFYAEPKALNSTFEGLMTAIREREATEKYCKEEEYDCEDATCIAKDLKCNGKVNCRFRFDEDETMCGKNAKRLLDSQHIVIILVVFSLIMFGMSFAFVFNCVRKLIRDHQIIREHIRQSRENKLDELGRKSTPCPISSSRTDIRDHSESPSLEMVPSKELLPPTTLITQEYTKDLVLEMTYNAKDLHEIHQTNNVTQEQMQESSEEPEMRDNFCQTRESLFETRIPETVAPSFTTFGFRAPSTNGTNHQHRHHHHHHHHHQRSPQKQHTVSPTSQNSTQQTHPGSQASSQCSGCSPAMRGRDGSMGSCPKHNPIPAPPGWSMHEVNYPLNQTGQYEQLDYPSYQRFQSPKPSREPSVYHQSPKLHRQGTVGSGERYGSSIYGSGHGSNNTTPSSLHSGTPKSQQQATDPRYRAEAVIEVDQRRPFSIESTKSAPDVIATH